MNKKSVNQRFHAKKRALQRFNLSLNREEYARIIKKIQKNESIPIRRESNRITVHEIEYQGKKIKAVYDKNHHTIVTFLY